MKMKLQEVFLEKRATGKAVLAFNIQNFHQLEALKDVVKNLDAPVIAQFSEKYAKHFDSMIGLSVLVRKHRITGLFFHLDHCSDPTFIRYCIESGFDSVMFDGSELPVAENAMISRQLFEDACRRSCLLEVELGVVGGAEDDKGSDDQRYFSTEELRYYHSNARYDLLALGIGNAHGVYNNYDALRMDLLDVARSVVGEEVNFVLHGGTGIPEEMVRQAIRSGVVKINISTNIKIETQTILKQFVSDQHVFDEIALKNATIGALYSIISGYVRSYTL